MTQPFWVTAFLDLAAGDFDRGVEFWRGVTGYSLLPRRGDGDEFATLVPPDGDPYLGALLVFLVVVQLVVVVVLVGV